MIKKLRDESGAAEVLEATVIFPIVFMCVLFLVLSGFTFLQRAMLQSTADRLSTYLARCVSYPGYSDIVDPFYGEANTKGMLERINDAMSISDPYRYVAGLFTGGVNSSTKEVVNDAKSSMTDYYLKSISFLPVQDGDVDYPSELESLKPETENGYVCAISASTSKITVYVGQNFMFARMFSLIGIGEKKMLIFGKSTANVSDSAEVIRLVDFAFDTIEDIASGLGIDIEKIRNAINKLTGNG